VLLHFLQLDFFAVGVAERLPKSSPGEEGANADVQAQAHVEPDDDDEELRELAASTGNPLLFEVITKLFSNLDVGRDAAPSGAEAQEPSVDSEEVLEDDGGSDTILGALARLLRTIEERASGERMTRELLINAATEPDFPDLEDLVAEAFKVADEDKDGALSDEEMDRFMDMLRDYVRDLLVDDPYPDSDEEDGDTVIMEAVSNVFAVLREGESRPIGKQELIDAAECEEHPEVKTLVETLADKADADGDGSLSIEEAREFRSLLAAYVHAAMFGEEDGD